MPFPWLLLRLFPLPGAGERHRPSRYWAKPRRRASVGRKEIGGSTRGWSANDMLGARFVPIGLAKNEEPRQLESCGVRNGRAETEGGPARCVGAVTSRSR